MFLKRGFWNGLGVPVLLEITVLFVFLCGCATTIKTNPQVTQMDNIGFRIKGKIVCEGNKDYLPRVLVDESLQDSKLTFRYFYNAVYGKYDVPDLVALYNPFTIVGFPTGENTVTIIGKLEVMKGEEVIKSYVATCVLEKTRSLFSEGTFTEMRRKGLIAVRNNIEVQVYTDRSYLEKILLSE